LESLIRQNDVALAEYVSASRESPFSRHLDVLDRLSGDGLGMSGIIKKSAG
jgi:hypothetical protein